MQKIDKSVPCYLCEKRNVTKDYNCHSDCPDYADYCKRREDRAETIRKARAEECMMAEMRIASIIKNKKDVNSNRQRPWRR